MGRAKKGARPLWLLEMFVWVQSFFFFFLAHPSLGKCRFYLMQNTSLVPLLRGRTGVRRDAGIRGGLIKGVGAAAWKTKPTVRLRGWG